MSDSEKKQKIKKGTTSLFLKNKKKSQEAEPNQNEVKPNQNEVKPNQNEVKPNQNEVKPTDSPAEKSLDLKQELKKAHTNYLYLMADFENYKKQMLKERKDLIRYAGEEFILSLINEVIDDFERALATYEEETSLSDFKKGMDIVYKNLQKILKNFNIQSTDPAGTLFDPTQQEAIARQKNTNVPPNQVLITLKKPYKLYDKVIRYGQVVVSEKEVKNSSDVKE